MKLYRDYFSDVQRGGALYWRVVESLATNSGIDSAHSVAVNLDHLQVLGGRQKHGHEICNRTPETALEYFRPPPSTYRQSIRWTLILFDRPAAGMNASNTHDSFPLRPRRNTAAPALSHEQGLVNQGHLYLVELVAPMASPTTSNNNLRSLRNDDHRSDNTGQYIASNSTTPSDGIFLRFPPRDVRLCDDGLQEEM